MKIAVVGAGGVGGYFGGRLAHAGVDTTFIARGAALQALRTNGLRVESIHGDFAVDRVQATDDPASAGVMDAILLTVKAWQIAEAAATIAPMLKEDTLVIPLENGIDAPEVLIPIVGREHVAGGLCAIVSYIVAPGHIRHAASDPFVMFGELDNTRTDRIERLRAAFEQAGINAQVPPDIQHSMWTKFLFIAVMSGVGALTRVPVGEWRSVPEIRELVTAALHEVAALAIARGIDLGDDAVEKTWQRYDALAPASTSSLQRDVMEGKPSELDAQLGAIVRLAREANVAVPVASMLYHALLPQERRARKVSS
ncbi:MAG TPA: 2-dehydropantoate 2-reductase [Thermoanaerobaculia bacterium]|nr:2-dehydropantoate 2-reductase [Thermoanaerobaculia bacterium]